MPVEAPQKNDAPYWSQKPESLLHRPELSINGISSVEAQTRLASLGRIVLEPRQQLAPFRLHWGD